MNQDVFISYSRRDYEIAKNITTILDANGYNYFIDIEGIAGGQEFAKVIAQAIHSCRVFVFLFSEHSNKSSFAIQELQYAIHENKKIILIGIDDSPLSPKLEFMLSNKAHLRITQPYFKENFLKLIGESLGNKVDWRLSEKQEKANLEAAEERRNGARDYVPQKIDVDIFISYRRVDGRDYARNIMQALKISGYPKVFFPDCNYLISTANDKTLRVWDVKSSKEIISVHNSEHWGFSAEFSPDGKWIVTACDGKINIWSVETGLLASSLLGHKHFIKSVCFSPDGRQIASSSFDNNIKVWDFPSLKNLIENTRERFKNRQLKPEERRKYYLE